MQIGRTKASEMRAISHKDEELEHPNRALSFRSDFMAINAETIIYIHKCCHYETATRFLVLRSLYRESTSIRTIAKLRDENSSQNKERRNDKQSTHTWECYLFACVFDLLFIDISHPQYAANGNKNVTLYHVKFILVSCPHSHNHVIVK